MAADPIPAPEQQDEEKIVKERWLHLADVAFHKPPTKEEQLRVDNSPIPISDYRK